MLPQWFAEYMLYLGLAGIVFCVAVIAFGYAGASTNHFTELLSDISQTLHRQHWQSLPGSQADS